MKKKFTLIELLVTISIISLLAALLLPSLQSARQKANRTNEVSNLKQLQQAILYYNEENNGYYPYIQSLEDTEEISKCIWLLLPYINYNTKIISPRVGNMNGRAIYNIMSSNPTASPIPGLSYNPIYEDSNGDTEILRESLIDIKDIPVIATPLNKYNKVIFLTYYGAVK